MSSTPFKKEIGDRKFVFLCGTIGAGKSTLLNKLIPLYANYKLSIIKEYIDYDEKGDVMLNDYLKGNITCIQFQAYILKCNAE